MQEHVTHSGYAIAANSDSSSERTFISHYDIKRFIKRYYATIAIATLLGVLMAAAYTFTAVPLYTARTQIIIDPSLPQTLRDQNSSGIFSIDNAQVESQLEVLRSEKIAATVIDKLKLGDNPAFSGGPPSLLARALSLFRSKNGTVDEFAKERSIMWRLLGGLSVRRVGLSYAIDIEYRSTSPKLAAEIANATADAYVAEQIAARGQSARQGGHWLEERIDKLRKQMNKSALDAQEFRAKRDYRIAPNRTAAGERGGNQSDAAASKEAAAHRQNTMEELDSTAQTYRRIYESYLMAYTESVQKQSYPITNARVITPATRPLSKSHPRTKLILAFGAMMGAFAGLGIAYFRHSIDRSVWGAHQIREDIGVECVASIPLLASHAPLSPVARAMMGKAAMGSMMRAVVDNPTSAVGPAVKTVKSGLALAGKKLSARAAAPASFLAKGGVPATVAADRDDILDAVITMPFSGFSHGIKSLKTAISLAGRMRQIRCIAITSALPNEGKTTIAANLATLFAISGVRTLLVDADIRNASLSRAFAPAAQIGLLEAIAGRAEIGQCIVRANEVGLDLLPASDAAHAAHSDEMLGSERAQCLIEELQRTYDIVIFELPPLSVNLDGLTLSSILDCTVLVAEWGRTPVPVLSESIRLLRSARADILGVALNKVDISTLNYGDIVTNYSYASHTPTQLGRRT
jgi:capsular exopolysaccharide synthesis family protein